MESTHSLVLTKEIVIRNNEKHCFALLCIFSELSKFILLCPQGGTSAVIGENCPIYTLRHTAGRREAAVMSIAITATG